MRGSTVHTNDSFAWTAAGGERNGKYQTAVRRRDTSHRSIVLYTDSYKPLAKGIDSTNLEALRNNRTDKWTGAQRTLESGQHVQKSLILGIVGFLLLPLAIVFGPLAIKEASKAEPLGTPATVGKFIGWIILILWILGLFSASIEALFVLPNLGEG